MNIQKVIAPDEEERRATHRNVVICKFPTEPKTYQEVLENFASIVEDDLRSFYEAEVGDSDDKPSDDKTESKDEKDDDTDE